VSDNYHSVGFVSATFLLKVGVCQLALHVSARGLQSVDVRLCCRCFPLSYPMISKVVGGGYISFLGRRISLPLFSSSTSAVGDLFLFSSFTVSLDSHAFLDYSSSYKCWVCRFI
jgi:hypothetical protein